MAAPLATEAVDGKTDDARLGSRLTATACGILCVVAIWTVLADTTVARTCSAVAFVAFLATAQGHFGLREKLLQGLALGAALAAILMLGDRALRLIVDDLSRASYLASFMLLVASLRQGAATSESVLSIGKYLTSQPPGRRYFALHVGGHFMGVLLNFGAISLLGPLVRRGVDAHRSETPPEMSEIRLRRQISALSRGFSWFNLWAPTAVAQAVVISIVPGSAPAVIAGLGVLLALLLLPVGWVEDKLTGDRARRRFAKAGVDIRRAATPAFPWRGTIRFLLVGCALIGTAAIISTLTGIALVSAIMISAAPVNLVWLAVQTSFRTRALSARAKALASTVIPSGSPEAATLGLAGFTGILAATLVNREWLAVELAQWLPAPIVLYLAVSALVPLASCIGLPPMMTVTFLGGLLASLPDVPLNASLLGLSLLVGWSLNLTGSPFGATSLLLSRVAGISGVVHAWRWNGLFTLLSWCVAALVLTVASSLL